jgi:RNA polymerase sigma-70 factor (ECF subfamily)
MADARDWHPERYRPLLQLQVRLMQLNSQFRRRFDSSDVVQDALLKAHTHRDRFRGATEPERVRWLQEVLKSVAMDKVREATAGKRDLRLELSFEAAVDESSARMGEFLAAPSPSPSQQAERSEWLLRLAQAIDRLAADQREVVIRRDLGGEPVAQIAERMGRTQKAIAGLLLRGRRNLREDLADFA